MEDTAKCEQVLLVDDDPGALEMLAAHLSAAGYDPIPVRNGLQALHMLQERKPQIVIADWIMPGMDGLALCRQIRSQADAGFVYFVMLTVQTEKRNLIEAFEAGVDDFLTKPFHEGELLARIRVGARMIRLHNELREQVSAVLRLNGELSRLNAKLHQLAGTDELTNVPNRRQGMIRLKELWAVSSRYKQPLSCAIIDVDGFKQINDSHGHLKGDEVLQKIASVLAATLRSSDTLCRIGGDEFLVLLPMQGAAEAVTTTARCQAAIASQVFIDPGRTEPVTISVGTTAQTAEMPGPDDMLREADRCLYEAKRRKGSAVASGTQSQ